MSSTSPKALLDSLPEEVEAVVEYPAGAMVKRDTQGRVDVVSPVPCPYNYGRIEGYLGGDGDPLDLILLGPRRRAGARSRARVIAVVGFVDKGLADHKVVCVPLERHEGLSGSERVGLRVFFAVYGPLKALLACVRGAARPTRGLGIIER